MSNKKIFISYSHTDQSRVEKLVELLREAGYDPWFDHRLLPGQDWKAELLKAITEADIFVYAITPESVASEWCQWEFSKAIELGKSIIPVLLNSYTNIPEVLKQYQYADFSEGLTGTAVARFIGGLAHVTVIIPPENKPKAPQNPRGQPAQALLNRRSPIFLRVIRFATIISVMVFLSLFLLTHPTPVPPTPISPMTGDFNIVVAQFAEIPDNANPLVEPVISQKIFHTLDSEYSGQIFGLEIQVRNYNTNPVTSYQDAENLAQTLNAQLVIYGTVTHFSDQTYDIEPFFFVANSLAADVNEVTGSHKLGPTISAISASQLGTILNEVLPVRIAVLVEFSKSLAYIQSDRLNLANDSVNNAIRTASTDANFRNNQILFLFASHIARLQHDFERARTNVEEALTLDPNYGRAYIGRGNISYDLGQQAFQAGDYIAAQEYLASAITDYERAKGLPDQPPGDFIVEKADTGVAQVYTIEFLISNQEDYAQTALSHFEAIIESYDQNPEHRMKGLVINALYWSGVIYHTQGKLVEAEAAFRHAQTEMGGTNTDYAADIERRLADIEQQK